ncbi:uncharacterized protein N7503_000426 [Penicillium pulvis]|uniref:uncharacterized protein n=1 Tax=Penicillium pulvis TaxID=1562058 RepID=UPI002546747A|nr:uncharacterized protein N7503_000426 [Penicillium pulvis]KAJ5813676.1 hypothetical protein N7503_000426 [Penicillium pulvis]
MEPATTSVKSRASKACIICHKKKIRCNVNEEHPCLNCRELGYECSTVLTYADLEKGSAEDIPTAHRHLRARKARICSIVVDASSNPVGNLSHLNQDAPHLDYDTLTECDTTYLGRSTYTGGGISIDEGSAKRYKVEIGGRAPVDRAMLELVRAFDLPPRTIRNGLLDSFLQICQPWMPIVDRIDCNGTPDSEPSILLLQAVYMAGARVSSAPLGYQSCEDIYRRAKVLFFSQYETNPMTVIRAACILQWWNPTGPEHISVDKASFWLRTCVSLAFDVGLHREPRLGQERSLRRRLWWTLYARDSLISAAQGRPRAINIEDSDVRPISLDDFTCQDRNAHLFVAHVRICSILGTLAEFCIRNGLTHSKHVAIERDLRLWISELPSCLRMYQQTPEKNPTMYDLEIWQLHVPYFTALTILYRPLYSTSIPSPVPLLSSSFVVGIFEDFLARDDVRRLNSIFTFHLLIASFPQLMCYKYSALRSSVEDELNVIKMALHEMSKQWDSALGPLRIIEGCSREVMTAPPVGTFGIPKLSPDEIAFFNAFGPESCRKWNLIFNSGSLSVEPDTVIQREPGNLLFDMNDITTPIPQAPLESLLEFDLSQYGFFMDWNSLDTH